MSRLIQRTMLISNRSDYPMDKLQALMDYFTPAKLDQLNRERYCVVAEEDGEICGTAGLEGNSLLTFFVDPAYQGMGVGKLLLRDVEAFAGARAIEELEVQSSLAGAEFYEGQGYRPTGVVIDGTAGPQIEMRKRIAAERDS